MNDVAFLDATAQADLVRKKQIKPIELLEGAIERVQRLNPKLNAVVTPMYDNARAAIEAGLPDGPFTGVPFLMKDLGPMYQGVRYTSGSRYLQFLVAPMDSELTIRQRKAGLVTFGKTNTPEFGLVPTTEPKLFGASRNPWDTERTTGGSSGGSAAAVASGMVPMAHANDGGGSIRIPASCCGLFGLKPTRGRVSLAPLFGDQMNGLTIDHAVTRSVRDSAALLDATAGPAPGDPYYAPPPERPFAQEVGREHGKLRSAFTEKKLYGEGELHPDCVEAVRDAVHACEDLGHEVDEAAPTLNGEQIIDAFTKMWQAGVANGIDSVALLIGRLPNEDEIEPLTRTLYEAGKQIDASAYLIAVSQMQLMARQMAALFETYDLWLTPTLGEPPVPLGTFDYREGEEQMAGFSRAADFVPYTPLQNATGQPAMSVPLYWSGDDLPIGVHFAARYGDEATLFRLAAQLEESRPWAHRRPPVTA